jgi:hypothetical protein
VSWRASPTTPSWSRARDAEGNEFRPLAEVVEGVYISISDERGDFFNDDEESGGEGVPAVCLWPEG